jgi:hypothetical protein
LNELIPFPCTLLLLPPPVTAVIIDAVCANTCLFFVDKFGKGKTQTSPTLSPAIITLSLLGGGRNIAQRECERLGVFVSPYISNEGEDKEEVEEEVVEEDESVKDDEFPFALKAIAYNDLSSVEMIK